MRDQAEELRQMVTRSQEKVRDQDGGGSRIITVTSGKGGVGKTSFTTNLGVCLCRMGYRVVIIDGDFGLANVDLMLGANARYGLREIILGRMDLEDVMVESPFGIKFISGGSGIKELINLEGHKMDDFLRKIEDLNQMADVILIDTGAGATDNIVKMVLAAHEAIILVTPEPTAITDAYALMKIISSVRRDMEFRLVVNRVDSPGEAQDILIKFKKTADRFLGVDVGSLGYIYDDPKVSKSIKEQVPYVIGYPKSQAAKQVDIIAGQLLKHNRGSGKDSGGLTSYFSRFLDLFGIKDRHEII